MSINVIPQSEAPEVRQRGAARDVKDFEEALKTARTLAPGKAFVVTLDAATLKQIGSRNPAASFASALRSAFRAEKPPLMRIVLQAKGGKVVVRHGTPRPLKSARKTA